MIKNTTNQLAIFILFLYFFQFSSSGCKKAEEKKVCDINKQDYIVMMGTQDPQKSCLPSHVTDNYRIRISVNNNTVTWKEIRRSGEKPISIETSFNPVSCETELTVKFKQSVEKDGERDVQLRYQVKFEENKIRSASVEVYAPCVKEKCPEDLPYKDCKFSANIKTLSIPCFEELSDEDFAKLDTKCDSEDDEDKCEDDYFKCEKAQLKCEEEGGTKVEICNGKDDDCDGQSDEGFPELGKECDSEDEDYCKNGKMVCNKDGSGVICYEDETQQKVEKCDNEDNDCDDETDEENAEGCKDYYVDSDGDTYGDETNKKCLCSPAEEFKVSKGGDCDDNDKDVFPGATEKCDDIDNNCSGITDEDCDKDKDEYCDKNKIISGNPSICKKGGEDCNDNDPNINPGVEEKCDNVDNNCNKATDENCDKDGDKYCDENMIITFSDKCPKGGGDCDDKNEGINPEGEEICNGKDDNCNGKIDENFPELGAPCDGDDEDKCENGIWACKEDYTGIVCSNDINILEVCDGKDNDCDEEIDEDFDLSSDPKNCGECNNACPQPGDNGVGSNVQKVGCKEKKCFIEECEEYFEDVDGVIENGCEKGCSVGPIHILSSGKTPANHSPIVSSRKEGGFLVVWDEEEESSVTGPLFAQFFDKNGKSEGDVLKIEDSNVGTFYNYNRPVVIPDNKGWLVAYQYITYQYENSPPKIENIKIVHIDSVEKKVDWKSQPLSIDGNEASGYPVRFDKDIVLIWGRTYQDDKDLNTIRFARIKEDGTLLISPKKIPLEGGNYPTLGFAVKGKETDTLLIVYHMNSNDNIFTALINPMDGTSLGNPVGIDPWKDSDENFLVIPHVNGEEMGIIFKSSGNNVYLVRIDYMGNKFAEPVKLFYLGGSSLFYYSLSSMTQKTSTGEEKGWVGLYWSSIPFNPETLEGGGYVQKLQWFSTEGKPIFNEKKFFGKLEAEDKASLSIAFDGNIYGIGWTHWDDYYTPNLNPKFTTISCTF